MDLLTLFYYVLGAAGLVALTYVCARVASIAHFRTRLEYFRSALKEADRVRGDNNGEE